VRENCFFPSSLSFFFLFYCCLEVSRQTLFFSSFRGREVCEKSTSFSSFLPPSLFLFSGVERIVGNRSEIPPSSFFLPFFGRGSIYFNIISCCVERVSPPLSPSFFFPQRWPRVHEELNKKIVGSALPPLSPFFSPFDTGRNRTAKPFSPPFSLPYRHDPGRNKTTKHLFVLPSPFPPGEMEEKGGERKPFSSLLSPLSPPPKKIKRGDFPPPFFPLLEGKERGALGWRKLSLFFLSLPPTLG